MALKDNWTDLEDKVQGDPDSGSDISGEPINKIAHAVIELEESGIGSSIIVDSEMSDESENPVQNKVIKKYIDETQEHLEKYIEDTILGGAW